MAKVKKLINNPNIEKELGTKKADDWTGTGGTDIFLAGNGNDICDGGNGADAIDGGKGGDTIEGGAGKDELYGGVGNDTISGGAGKDVIDGGKGNDTINGDAGNDTVLGGEGDDDLNGGSGNDVVEGGLGNDAINDDSGNDKLSGGDGNDVIDGGSGVDQISGDAGDDTLNGGDANDVMNGGDGNDTVVGDKGDDQMIGGLGDDVLDWDDGDGNDVMSGNEGRDTIEVDGSVSKGDNFVLGKNAEGKAFFERVGLDGQPVDVTNGGFNLTVDTAEIFDVSGDVGNDTFIINDLSNTGVEEIQFDGGEGNDLLDGRNTSTHIVANGGNGDDTLIGGSGTIQVAGANGAVVTLGDTLTGGAGKDKFQFSTDPFLGVTPGQNSNKPDVITDYEIGVDQLVFDKQKFGLNELKFQKGDVTQLAGDSNLLVLEGKFAAAGVAAKAIADNNNLTAKEGVFVYYNSTLNISRAVFSSDLANNGAFSVQGNLANLNSAEFQKQFTAADFGLA